MFKAARSKAGLRAPKERRAAPARLTLEEQLRFIDAAYARSGQTGLMVQTLLETGTRRAGPLFLSRQKDRSGSRTYTHQRIGQMVREVARDAGITKRLYPHLLRHTMATRLLALGMAARR